jgi:hypothetical protein
MLKKTEEELAEMELKYPDIRNQVRHFEAIQVSCCPHCASQNTAVVQCGVIGRTIGIASATTKFHLRANGRPAPYYCCDCERYFLEGGIEVSAGKAITHVLHHY